MDDKIKKIYERRKQDALIKRECKVRNTQTNKIQYILSNFDWDNRTRHFFNPHNPEEEYPEGLYVLEPVWSYEEFGIECGDGWKPLITPILEYIKEYNKDKPEEEHIEIHQIKEKFAELRVHLNFYNDEITELIRQAEIAASQTCEICGSTHDVGLSMGGWLTIKCKQCVVKNAHKRNTQIKWRRNGNTKACLIDGKGDEMALD